MVIVIVLEHVPLGKIRGLVRQEFDPVDELGCSPYRHMYCPLHTLLLYNLNHAQGVTVGAHKFATSKDSQKAAMRPRRELDTNKVLIRALSIRAT